MSDRIAGLLLTAFVVWYGVTAWGIQSSFFSDPLGSRAFPLFVAFVLAPPALYLMFRRQPDVAVWAHRASWPALAATLAIFVAYALLLEPLGFLLANTLVFFGLGLVFRAPIVKGLIASAVATGVLYVLFAVLLDLYLPFGELFERWRP